MVVASDGRLGQALGRLSLWLPPPVASDSEGRLGQALGRLSLWLPPPVGAVSHSCWRAHQRWDSGSSAQILHGLEKDWHPAHRGSYCRSFSCPWTCACLVDPGGA